jgi:microcystin-dependent protein
MDPCLGEIRIFAGSYAPVDWELCNGQLVPITQYEALYSLLGTTFGGDGTSTFGLPDLRGRAPVSLGTGAGLSAYALGSKGGYDTITLGAGQMAAHTHPFVSETSHASSASPVGNVPAAATVAFYTQAAAAPLTVDALANASVGSFGSGGSHDNSMPSLPLNYIIATQGLYPQPA